MAERIFLPWTEAPLPAAAKWLADRRGEDGELDLGEVLVAVPGGRAGRRLTELLVEEAERRGVVLTPAETVTVRSLSERLYEPPSAVAGTALTRLAWAEALRSLDPDRRAAVFPDPPDADDLSGWIALAEVVHGLHRETAAEGLAFADVARACGRGDGYDDGRRWRVLAEVQDRYFRRLEEAGHVDRDAARHQALDRGRVGSDREIVLVGVTEMPGVIASMLRALETPVSALIHAPEEMADAFDDLGRVRPEAWREREIDVPPEAVALRGRPPAQADEAVRRLSGEGRKLAPDEITVGVPNEDLVPYLEQRLGAYGVPHRHGAGTPMARTGPYRMLSAVADYLEGRRFEDFAALVRHPEVSRGIDVAGALEAADRHFEDRLPARVRPGRERELRHDDRFGDVLRSVEKRLRLGRLAGRRPLDRWMEEILGLLRRIYGGRTLDRGRASDRRTIEALERLRDAAAEIHGLPDGAAPDCTGAEALRLVLADVRDGEVPPLPDRSAVEMLGWLELHLDDAPALVITGFDEDHVPASVSAHEFLPDGLRGRLGLVDNAWRHGRDAYLFSAVLASREEVHVVVGRRNADGDPLRPSRLLLAASGPELAERARRLFDEEPPTTAPLPRLGVQPGGSSEFRSPPEPALTVDPPESLRVTDFRLLLRDPYRWVLENRLDLEAVDDRRRELDALQFGSLAHEVLHRFGESPEAGSTDPASIRDRLHGELDDAAGRRYGGALPAVRLQVEQLRARLSDFADWQAERVRAGWETVAVEVATPEEGVPLEVDGEPVGIRGRIDRIDRHPDTGRWEVLDYKTGSSSADPERSHRKGGEWVDLQLPLYRHLLEGLEAAGALPSPLTAPGSDVSLGYVSLSREGTGRAVADWTRGELEDALEAARRIVRELRSGTVRYREGADAPGGEGFGPLVGEGRLRAESEGEEP